MGVMGGDGEEEDHGKLAVLVCTVCISMSCVNNGASALINQSLIK
jgi:hypothetical protein